MFMMLDRWKIIISSVPVNLASANIIQWVVQLRYSFPIVLRMKLVNVLIYILFHYTQN